MHATFNRGNAVGVTVDALVITSVPLQGYFKGLI